MENIIKKAIEGGWKPKHLGRAMTLLSGHAIIDINFATDPSFWQSLGKACGWELFEILPICPHCGKKDSFGERVFSWKWRAQYFHEINLTEGWDAAIEYLHKITN